MTDIDVDKVCRVCLQSDIELSLLFDEQNAVGSTGLSDMISECTIYTVWRYDGFPELICNNCKEKVYTAYAFKKQFEASHRKLMRLLEMNLVLPDPSSDPNDKCTQTDDSSLYPCEKCDEKFITYERLRDHRLSAHKGTANACRLCPKSFNRISDLKNHIAVYHPESGFTPNECGICKKKFIRKDHVTRHLRKVHKIGAGPNGSNKKEDRSTLYETESEMIREQNPEIGTVVDPMGSEIKTGMKETEPSKLDRECLLQKPKLEIHSDDDVADSHDNDGTRDGFAKCNSFRDDEEKTTFLGVADQNVAEHLDLVYIKEEPNEIQPELNSDIPSPGDAKRTAEEQLLELSRRYKCDQCDKVYVRSSHLKRHILSHSKVKSFACRFCNKKFHRSDHLKKHYRSKHKLGVQSNGSRASREDNDLPEENEAELIEEADSDPLNQMDGFEITFYGDDMEATNPVDSTNPMEMEEQKPDLDTLPIYDSADGDENGGCVGKSSGRQFKCSQCDRVYARNNHLRRHMLSHSEEKPYSCRMCEKRFNRSDHLKNHLNKHHSDKS